MKRVRILDPITLRPGDTIENFDHLLVVSSNMSDHIVAIEGMINVKILAHSRIVRERFYVYQTPAYKKIIRALKNTVLRIIGS